MSDRYETIGGRYRERRRPDPRVAAAILRELGDAESVLNVGAGTGSYEPEGRRVIAVEPSMTMIRQRSPAAPPVARASASALPFRNGAFDASLAVLTVHHWPDKPAGLAELRRVARRLTVILTWDPTFLGFWLTDYFPRILEIDRAIFPTMAELRRELGPLAVVMLPIPHDCADGFLGAYWRRPRLYLDASVRSAISTFSKLADAAAGLSKLEGDLDSGEWERRYGEALPRDTLDLGYRLVVAG